MMTDIAGVRGMGEHLHGYTDTTGVSMWSESDPAYVLEIRQQPLHGRVVTGMDQGDRKPIDPPPILQLHVSQRQDPMQNFLQSPYFFVSCSLLGDDSPIQHLHAPLQQPPPPPPLPSSPLVGTAVSSLHRLKDTDGQDGAFFVFGDLSCRIEGRFRLSFSLYQMVRADGDDYTTTSGAASYEYVRRATAISDVFTVFLPRLFPGLSASTGLTRAFSGQGVRLRLRKDPQRRSRRQRGHVHQQRQGHSSHHMVIPQRMHRILTMSSGPLTPLERQSIEEEDEEEDEEDDDDDDDRRTAMATTTTPWTATPPMAALTPAAAKRRRFFAGGDDTDGLPVLDSSSSRRSSSSGAAGSSAYAYATAASMPRAIASYAMNTDALYGLSPGLSSGLSPGLTTSMPIATDGEGEALAYGLHPVHHQHPLWAGPAARTRPTTASSGSSRSPSAGGAGGGGRSSSSSRYVANMAPMPLPTTTTAMMAIPTSPFVPSQLPDFARDFAAYTGMYGAYHAYSDQQQQQQQQQQQTHVLELGLQPSADDDGRDERAEGGLGGPGMGWGVGVGVGMAMQMEMETGLGLGLDLGMDHPEGAGERTGLGSDVVLGWEGGR